MSMLTPSNLINKLSFNLQSRFVSLTSLKRSGVRCFARSADDQGFPVRYVPKKRLDDKQRQSSTSKDTSSKSGMPKTSNGNPLGYKMKGKRDNVQTQKRTARILFNAEHELNQESYDASGVIDTKHKKAPDEVVEELDSGNRGDKGLQSNWDQDVTYSNGTLESEDVRAMEAVLELRQRFKLNQEISYLDEVVDSEYMDEPDEVLDDMQITGGGRSELRRSNASKTRKDAEKLAVELLAKRGYTAVELRKKLVAKHFPLDTVQTVIHDFQVRGLINDRLYAETYSQSRWTSSSWGPRRIKQALSKKGVSKVEVEEAVKLVFEDGKDGDGKSSTRLSNSSIEKLYTQALKQWERSKNVPHEKRKARVIRWLQYRGFDWGVVSIILRKLESQHPP